MKITSTVLCALLVLSGCISTTSGPSAPEADREDAAEYNYQLGARYYRNGKYELARDRLMLSLDYDPRRASAWSTLALTYEALENVRLAEEAYKEAVKVEPRSYDALNAFAVFLCRQQKFDQGARAFEKAAAISDNDTSEISLTNAGVCMVQKPDYGSAERYFRQALEKRSTHPEALLQMCLLKFQTEDFMGARAFLQRYLTRNVSTPSVLYLGVQIEDRLGDARARSEFEDQLIREFPTSAEARSILAAD